MVNLWQLTFDFLGIAMSEISQCICKEDLKELINYQLNDLPSVFLLNMVALNSGVYDNAICSSSFRFLKIKSLLTLLVLIQYLLLQTKKIMLAWVQ